jgi:class 3 adenylate cyclase
VGLELIQAVGGLKSSAPLQTRVGIATGLVVVGDLIGSGEAQERGIVGETPNLAARLQAIAEPNTVVIAEHGTSLRVDQKRRERTSLVLPDSNTTSASGHERVIVLL